MSKFPQNYNKDKVYKEMAAFEEMLAPVLEEFMKWDKCWKPGSSIRLTVNEQEDISYVHTTTTSNKEYAVGCAPQDVIRHTVLELIQSGFYLFYQPTSKDVYVRLRDIIKTGYEKKLTAGNYLEYV